MGFESRRNPRFPLNLPLEYHQIESPASHKGLAANASEGGPLIYSPEQLKVGQQLKFKIFFYPDAEMDSLPRALLKAQKRDVRVEVILDKGQRKIKYSSTKFFLNPDGYFAWKIKEIAS